VIGKIYSRLNKSSLIEMCQVVAIRTDGYDELIDGYGFLSSETCLFTDTTIMDSLLANSITDTRLFLDFQDFW
jgi:hypothetical protein